MTRLYEVIVNSQTEISVDINEPYLAWHMLSKYNKRREEKI